MIHSRLGVGSGSARATPATTASKGACGRPSGFTVARRRLASPRLQSQWSCTPRGPSTGPRFLSVLHRDIHLPIFVD